MSWIQKLNEAYDRVICAKIPDGIQPLLPSGFTQKKIKYHIILDHQGEFVSAEEWDGKSCIVPSTPQAEGRTGDNGAPFPLADQLKYFACEEKENPRLQKYLDQLSVWCGQPDAPECLRILKTYLEKKTLLQDLTEKQHLHVKFHKVEEDHDGKGKDSKEFVCFSVWDKSSVEKRLWEREDVKASWSNYIAKNASDDWELCYVKGRLLPSIDNHPKVQGNAKLISAKDAEYPFLYRGRFAEDRSAVSVSYEASIRAHNMLDWLIERRQGFRKYGLTLVAWNTDNTPMAVPVDDDYWEDDAEEDAGEAPDTFEVPARAIRDATLGYESQQEGYDVRRMKQIVILGLEAATDGRMSVIYYQELEGNTYRKRLKNWYDTCRWIIWKDKISTPTPEQISRAVMGIANVRTAKTDLKCEKSATKQMRGLRMRLLRCIVDGVPLPRDMVQSAFHRAVSPPSFTDSKGSWSEFEWRSCLAVACALIAKYRYDWKQLAAPEFDSICSNRDCLYGRLLAVADMLEYTAMNRPKNYQTNAIRYMQRFVQRPAETWMQIHLRLIPYLRRLGGTSAAFYQRQLGEIEQAFDSKDRLSNAPLSFDFLCGYSSQRQKLFEKDDPKENTIEKPASETKEKRFYPLPSDRDSLYGCLLAVADVAEYRAVKDSYHGSTNALQLMHTFAAYPIETWKHIHDKLIPYLKKLEKTAKFYQYCITTVETSFAPEDRCCNDRLNAGFLHAYYGMRQALLNGMTPQAGEALPQTVWMEKLLQMDDTIARDIAYGRLLSLENLMERRVLDTEKTDENNRSSNAMKWMTTFSRKPASVWSTILRQKLIPYERKANWRVGRKYIEEKTALDKFIQENGWDTDDPLTGLYLYGFYRTMIEKKGEE